MNKIKTIALFTLLCIVSSTYAAKIKCTLSGKITHPNNDSVFLKDNNDNIIQSCRLGKKNTFSMKLELEEGYYIVSDETEQTTVYLSSGFDVYLTLDTKMFDETIEYKGIGAQENNYLAKKTLSDEQMSKQKNYGYYARLEEEAFLKLSDSVKQLELTLLESYKNGMQSTFYALEKMKVEYDIYSNIYNYESMHGMLTNNREFKVSSSYPDPLKNIELNREEWADAYEYTNMVEKYLEDLAGKDVIDQRETDYYVAFFKNMERYLTVKKMREDFAFNIGLYRLSNSKKLDTLYSYIVKNIEDTSKISKVTSVYRRVKAMTSGTLVPSFEFKDINGKLVNLKDFRGKYVYIDIWATWCGPCVYEVPFLKTLHDTLSGKNIELVSICMSDYEQNWRSFINKKSLKGVQLFAENHQTEFFDSFIVSGIPRFILLDKEGKIIEYDARRPSDPALLEQLLNLLSQ